MPAPLPGDKSAGYTGLIVGAVTLLIALYGIVHLTNVHYANLEGKSATPAAEAH
jgi:hypothetical protein